MMGGANVERWGEKCRRADIPEMEHGWRGGWVSNSGRIADHGLEVEGKIVGAPTILFLESGVRRTSKDDRIDFSEGQAELWGARVSRAGVRRLPGQENVGAPTFSFWQRRFWSAGACSRFFGVGIGGQESEWQVALPSEKRRPLEAQDEQAAALQNCRRADNSKNWKFGIRVIG